jgi:uncharacterized phiE125 gp8 family phage protein
MYRPTLSTAATATPITYEEAVAHLRVDADDEEELIRLYIDSAVAYLDGYYGVLGRALVTQTWVQKYDGWDAYLYLPVFPVASITSVVYLDTTGASTTVSASDYQLFADECGYYVAFDQAFSYPSVSVETGPTVTVTYVAGQAVTSVPASLKHALLLLVAHAFENREPISIGGISSKMVFSIEHLIAPYRRVSFG